MGIASIELSSAQQGPIVAVQSLLLPEATDAQRAPIDPAKPNEPATFKSQAPAAYPDDALCHGIGGVTELLITIDANGDPIDVVIRHSTRDRSLDRAAIEAAKKWRFNPAIWNGDASVGLVRVPVDSNRSQRRRHAQRSRPT